MTQSGEPEDAICGANLVALSTWFERTAPPVDGEPGYEQSCTKRGGRVEHRDGVFLHLCTQRGAWGSYGYGVDVRASHPGQWYCSAHRPIATDAQTSWLGRFVPQNEAAHAGALHA